MQNVGLTHVHVPFKPAPPCIVHTCLIVYTTCLTCLTCLCECGHWTAAAATTDASTKCTEPSSGVAISAETTTPRRFIYTG